MEHISPGIPLDDKEDSIFEANDDINYANDKYDDFQKMVITLACILNNPFIRYIEFPTKLEKDSWRAREENTPEVIHTYCYNSAIGRIPEKFYRWPKSFSIYKCPDPRCNKEFRTRKQVVQHCFSTDHRKKFNYDKEQKRIIFITEFNKIVKIIYSIINNSLQQLNSKINEQESIIKKNGKKWRKEGNGRLISSIRAQIIIWTNIIESIRPMKQTIKNYNNQLDKPITFL